MGFDDVKDKVAYGALKAQIETSQLDEETEDTLSNTLKQGRELVKTAQESNPELASKFTKEYVDLTEEIKKELSEAKRGIRDGIDGVMLELKDLKDLAAKQGVEGQKSWYSSLGDSIYGTNTQDNGEYNEFLEKPVGEYSPELAKKVLSKLQSDFGNYESSTQDKIWLNTTGLTVTSLGEVNSAEKVNILQGILISKIYGEGISGQGFSGENLVGFASDEGGNYIISVSDFEQKLQNGDNINPKVFTSYVNYLENTLGNGTPEFKSRFSRYTWSRKDKIDTFLNTSDDSTVGTTKQRLIDMGLFSEEQGWIDWFQQKLQEGINLIFGNLQETIQAESFDIKNLDEQILLLQNESENALSQRANITIPNPSELIKSNAPIIFEKSKDADISGLQNPELKADVLSQREKDLAEKARIFNEQIQQNYGPLFKNDPEIMAFLEKNLDITSPINLGPAIFIENLNVLIDTHNTKYQNSPEKRIPPMTGEVLLGVLSDIDAAKALNLEVSHTSNLKKFEAASQSMLESKGKLEEIEAAMLTADGVRLIALQKEKALVEQDIEGAESECARVSEDLKTGLIARGKAQENTVVLNSASNNPEIAIATGVELVTLIKEQEEAIAPELVAIQENTDREIQRLNRMQEALASGNIKEVEEILTIIKSEDQERYTRPDWDKHLQIAQQNYEKNMVRIYGEDWESTVPVKPQKDLYRNGTNSGISQNTKDINAPIFQGELTTFNNAPAISTVTGEIISITPEEAKIAKENPEAIPNIINCRKFFEASNLSGICKYMPELIQAAGSINIQLDSDAVNPRELVVFGNKLINFINTILVSEGQDPLHGNNQSPYSIMAELRKFSSGNSFVSAAKSKNAFGEDIFTSYMRKYGFLGGTVFRIGEVRNAMSGNFTAS